MRDRSTAMPSPAWTYWLMTGEMANARIHGWVDLGTERQRDVVAAELWDRHGERLTADAASAGFEPYAATKRRPHGPAVDAWEQRFPRQHTY